MIETVGTPKISQIDVLASGLDSPRKLSFGPDGALYVAEAGRGGTGASIPSPSRPGVSLSYGATGAITRIQDGVAQRVVTGLPSLAAPDGTEAAGVNDIQFDRDGNAYAIVGFGSDPANRDSLHVPDFAQLIGIDRFDGGASWTRLSDFGAYEQANNPDGQSIDTNPFALLIHNNTVYVADAGGNDLLSQRAFASQPTLEAVFPNQPTTDPRTGKTVSRQAVPTSVAAGPDGALYVGELTGGPFQAGTAQVFRLNAKDQPEVYAGGFTNITDLAFDKSGGLYVLEYDADGIGTGSDAGALIYVSPDRKTRTTIDDQLTSPTGLALDVNGDIYISNKGAVAGQGEVLRLKQDDLLCPGSVYDQAKHHTTTISAKRNSERTLAGFGEAPATGFLADEQHVIDLPAEMKLEDADVTSPIHQIVDTNKLGFLGHSFGNYAGLATIQGINNSSVSIGHFH
jgi:sugar lactone lactonase YvrE